MEINNGTKLFENGTGLFEQSQVVLLNENANQSNDIFRELLEATGIYEAEQFVGISHNPDSYSNLLNQLNLDESSMKNLLDICKGALGEREGFYYREVFQYSLGLSEELPPKLLKENLEFTDFRMIPSNVAGIDERVNRLCRSVSETELPDSFNLVQFVPRCTDQGSHPTCAAFAATCSNEFRMTYIVHNGLKNYIVLSEGSLFCEAKGRDGLDYSEGTTLHCISDVLREVGQAKVRLYPYERMNDNVCANHSLYMAYNNFDLQYQKAGSVQINPRSIDTLKKFISNRHLPFIGVKLYDSIWNSRTTENGFINMPLQNDGYYGSHAICLVGYQNDRNYPGGGYFIFRNSWGATWSYNNYTGQPGIGFLPYAYVEQECTQAFVCG